MNSLCISQFNECFLLFFLAIYQHQIVKFSLLLFYFVEYIYDQNLFYAYLKSSNYFEKG